MNYLKFYSFIKIFFCLKYKNMQWENIILLRLRNISLYLGRYMKALPVVIVIEMLQEYKCDII